MADKKRVLILIIGTAVLPGALLAGAWADRFRAWHGTHEFCCYGDDNSADLAGWESYLLHAYLPMYRVTGDDYWLDRFVAHADTMLGIARDVPSAGDYWPGYKDGFLGWGTGRYDANARYQEYMLHDARICLPVARFARLVAWQPARCSRYEKKAKAYVDFIERNVVAKWYRSWSAERGEGEALETFGDWRRLPVNQFLAFGELLLVMADIARSPGYEKAWTDLPDGFYIETAGAMARAFKSSLVYQSGKDAYAWRTSLAGGNWEDLSHGDVAISFALEAYRQRRAFNQQDMERFAHCLTRTMKVDPAGFSHLVNGSGGADDVAGLGHWLQLSEFDPEVGAAVERAYETNSDWSSPPQAGSHMALTMAGLAELDAASPEGGRFRFSRDTRPTAIVAGSEPVAAGLVRQERH